jgi:hypothetical protein
MIGEIRESFESIKLNPAHIDVVADRIIYKTRGNKENDVLLSRVVCISIKNLI